ncbi:traf-type zinc finger family protein [Stylonychia lemnae]|uniref:Traf-type zinc finger family protein n=1 Tax=Stylonychia lemnae TaxID=5949 RepID=A0A078ATT5_STYLE|nr:traf-type zinc finger family protein [Stylonychia lemnae]|eukprot:CDW85664.1 traf-type zinc finger family protein [Stylonychia lemnae]
MSVSSPISKSIVQSYLYEDLLEFSPFNFFNGINPKRLLKGQSEFAKAHLLKYLLCKFCGNIVVQGKECVKCENNFCSPCIKKWEASDSARYYQTPCKCRKVTQLKFLGKTKNDYLQQIRFRCQNRQCHYSLTYEELILGTHELDDCKFIKIICEGCGARIMKQDQLKHETVECPNPQSKCRFCQKMMSLKEVISHQKDCNMRVQIKIEYDCSYEAKNEEVKQEEEESKEDKDVKNEAEIKIINDKKGKDSKGKIKKNKKPKTKLQ